MTARNERLIGFARSMRREPTDAERAVRHLLRGRRFLAREFRRQVPVGSFIADFVCFAALASSAAHSEKKKEGTP